MKVRHDILISEVKVEEFDVIIFVGDMGSSEYWDDPVVIEFVKKSGFFRQVNFRHMYCPGYPD